MSSFMIFLVASVNFVALILFFNFYLLLIINKDENIITTY